MSEIKGVDVVGMGHAIMDIIVSVADRFLTDRRLVKGSMQLMDAYQTRKLYADLPVGQASSGGSAANTIATLALCGANTRFIGKVHDDRLGELFIKDLNQLNVKFPLSATEAALETARSMIMVTPDAQRTMATFLGAAGLLTPNDIHPSFIEDAAILYLEGYLWDRPDAISAMRRAIDIAKRSNTCVAFTLSDAFCVERHHSAFMQLMSAGEVDILFANEQEIKTLCGVNHWEDVRPALLPNLASLYVVTRGPLGAVVMDQTGWKTVPALANVKPVDTTGAGDAFAAGFLYGYTQSWSHERSAAYGCHLAGHVIQHVGARLSHLPS
jgi:sugar/nucleoside kinase (ribokinase family)